MLTGISEFEMGEERKKRIERQRKNRDEREREQRDDGENTKSEKKSNKVGGGNRERIRGHGIGGI